MAIGSLFTLFVLPSVYVLLAKDHSKDRVKQGAESPVLDTGATVHAK
jgi:multidrug efflux pump